MSAIEHWQEELHTHPRRHKKRKKKEDNRVHKDSIWDDSQHLRWPDPTKEAESGESATENGEYTLIDFAKEFEEVDGENAISWEEHQSSIRAAEEAQDEEVFDPMSE